MVGTRSLKLREEIAAVLLTCQPSHAPLMSSSDLSGVRRVPRTDEGLQLTDNAGSVLVVLARGYVRHVARLQHDAVVAELVRQLTAHLIVRDRQASQAQQGGWAAHDEDAVAREAPGTVVRPR